MAAGGYHAKTYGSCFFWSNVVTLASVMTAKLLWEVGSFRMELALWGLYLWAAVYIARQAPVVSGKAPMKEELIVRNRTMARKLLILGACGLIMMRMVLNNGLSYVGVIAICIVAFMLRITKEGGAS